MMKFLQSSMLAIFLLFLLNPLQAEPAKPEAQELLAKLKEGNQRFVDLKTKHPNLGKERRQLLKGVHKPFAVIVSCSDSRVPPEIIFDQGLGDLFIVRSAGNTVDNLGLGSIEYAVAVLEAPLVIVMGHEKCGAVSAAMSGKALPGHIADVGKSITLTDTGKSCNMEDKLDCAIIGNVEGVAEKIKNSQPVLAPLVQSGKMLVIGAYYDFETGKVLFDK